MLKGVSRVRCLEKILEIGEIRRLPEAEFETWMALRKMRTIWIYTAIRWMNHEITA
jgi:hypothetical protein